VKVNFMSIPMPLPQIKLGTVVPGASFIEADDKGVNETFVGLIQLPEERLRAYIKVLSGRQLINELICVTVGRAAGLPIPEGFLLKATADDLPESRMISSAGGETLIFGSAAVGCPSLRRRLTKPEPEILAELLSKWKGWVKAAIFDEWIANPDRHSGNLLLESFEHVWLIDHSHALTGPFWEESDLISDKVVENQLADVGFPPLSLPERVSVRDKANELTNIFKLIDADTAMQSCHLNALLSSSEYTTVKKFVTDRVNCLIKLICNKLGMPRLEV
jgi:hypothetical protein